MSKDGLVAVCDDDETQERNVECRRRNLKGEMGGYKSQSMSVYFPYVN